MKNFKLFGFGLLCMALATFTSCDKESLDNGSIDETVIENPNKNNDDSPRVSIVNGIETDVSALVSVHINGEELVEGLGFKEITDLLPVELGDISVDILSEDGTILTSSILSLEEHELYNIFLFVGSDGLPALELLDLDIENITDISQLVDGLGLDILPEDLFSLSILDLSNLDIDNLLAGVDLLGENGEIVSGILDLENGIISDEILANTDILESLDLLNSDLPLLDLLTTITGGENNPLEILDLGNILAITNLGDATGLLDIVTDLVTGLLGDILGIGGSEDNPLSLLDGDILNGLPLVPGNDYTLVILGDENHLDYILVDNTLLGIPLN